MFIVSQHAPGLAVGGGGVGGLTTRVWVGMFTVGHKIWCRGRNVYCGTHNVAYCGTCNVVSGSKHLFDTQHDASMFIVVYTTWYLGTQDDVNMWHT